jgi:alkanesulfonate monooxygenase SsuD/methylene tetrahydromethanopterin reductase-like flavin-dependent oxidoreductase (luciferase family)
VQYSVWVSSGHSWDEILGLCRHIESTGWDGIWIPDHFMPPEGGYGNEPEPGHDPELDPVHEGWSLVAALAGLIPRVRLGVLVSGNTYRHPAVLANMAATIDHISGGRLLLGLGSGWQENEHRRYGIPYPTPLEFSDRLEEAAAVITALMSLSRRSTVEGVHYELIDAPLEPKPIQNPMPLLIGGGGERRTLRTAARYATHSNIWGTPETMTRKRAILDQHCREAGRDPADVSLSANAFLIFIDDPDEGASTRSAMGDRCGLVGTPDQIRQQIEDYQAAGVDEIVIAGFSYTPETFPEALERLRTLLDQ